MKNFYKRRAAVIILMTILIAGCANTKNSSDSDMEYPVDSNVQEENTSAVISSQEELEIQNTEEVKKVGVAMPTRSSERWINDGTNMKARLEALGYEVDLQYADDDIKVQREQIENMITNGADCLVIASIDSTKLVGVLSKAKREGIPVIAYDRLLMNTDAVSYYATFDNKEIGKLIGNYIINKMELKLAKESGKSYTIEFFMGSPDDNNALFLYDGLMKTLQPYLDNGALVCKSGKLSFEETCILRWSEDTARSNCEELLETYYQTETLDIACSAFDGFAYGIKDALLTQGYEVRKDWPLITGQDAELTSVRNVIAGYQAMSVYKDTRLLATKCVKMVQAVLEDSTPEINDRVQYHNGNMLVPSYLCRAKIVDKSNYWNVIIDGGYYTEEQLFD